jgi:hypothetical protein
MQYELYQIRHCVSSVAFQYGQLTRFDEARTDCCYMIVAVKRDGPHGICEGNAMVFLVNVDMVPGHRLMTGLDMNHIMAEAEARS